MNELRALNKMLDAIFAYGPSKRKKKAKKGTHGRKLNAKRPQQRKGS